MVSVGRNPQKKDKTSKLCGLEGEETNTLIFRLIFMEGGATQDLTKINSFLKLLKSCNTCQSQQSQNCLFPFKESRQSRLSFFSLFQGQGCWWCWYYTRIARQATESIRYSTKNPPKDTMLLGTWLTMHLHPHSGLQLNEPSMTQDCTQILKSFSAVLLCSVSQHSREC